MKILRGNSEAMASYEVRPLGMGFPIELKAVLRESVRPPALASLKAKLLAGAVT
ncbi:MAG TPA: hypothetical protein VEF34_00170 [Syntrophobacteraceae bacterium]|nr:hypothetical protein [Syntrophobacteraceae bacterium]